MEHSQEHDLVRINELLRRTGEFIAYFEHAETKMMAWRQDIELQTINMQHQANQLRIELESIKNLFSEAGTSNFRATVEEALVQGDAHLKSIERSCAQFKEDLQQNHNEINALTTKSLEKIDQYAIQASQNIAAVLAKYDPQHFNRIATESCDHVEQVAQDAITNSKNLFHRFQFRLGLFSVILTILTTFIIVLYISDEYPWEMHSQAMNERQAGKVLLDAWPMLSQAEKEKILSHERG